MVAKCDPELIDFLPLEKIHDLCESPNMYDFIEAQVPLTDINEGIHFRNVFCAYCNNMDILNLHKWQLELHCDARIDVSEGQLLQSVKQKRCNIFYLPPKRVTPNTCKLPLYTISKCNQSGLWTERNETIEWACNSFMDPFNATYKNYFCYLCNVQEPAPPHNWHCLDPYARSTGPAAVFTARFDIEALRKLSVRELICHDVDQFADYKMVRQNMFYH